MKDISVIMVANLQVLFFKEIRYYCGKESISFSYSRSRGGGGYSHIWATQVCAAQQGMLFASDSGTWNKNHPFSLEEGIFYFRFDSGTGSIFPRVANSSFFLWNRSRVSGTQRHTHIVNFREYPPPPPQPGF